MTEDPLAPEATRLLAVIIDTLADCRWVHRDTRQLEFIFGEEVAGD